MLRGGVQRQENRSSWAERKERKAGRKEGWGQRFFEFKKNNNLIILIIKTREGQGVGGRGKEETTHGLRLTM